MSQMETSKLKIKMSLSNLCWIKWMNEWTFDEYKSIYLISMNLIHAGATCCSHRRWWRQSRPRLSGQSWLWRKEIRERNGPPDSFDFVLIHYFHSRVWPQTFHFILRFFSMKNLLFSVIDFHTERSNEAPWGIRFFFFFWLSFFSLNSIFSSFLFPFPGLFGNILIVTLMPAIISSLLFIAFFIIPESPRFLSTRGNFDNAKTILLKFKSIDRDVESDVQVWSAAHHRAGFKSAFQQDFQFSQAISLFGVFLFEQLIGAISILFYLNKILTLTGEQRWHKWFDWKLKFHYDFLFSFAASEYTPELSAIVCGTAFAASIFLPYLISIPYSSLRSGLIWSNVLMGLCLAILGTFCHYQGSFGHIYTEDYRYLPLVCLVIFFSVYANGPSRLVQELADQIIPKKHDFTIRCLLTVTTWSLIYAITRNLPRLIDLIGVGWLFWFMTIMCFFATIFVKLFVPDLRKLPEESKLVESSESFSEAWSLSDLSKKFILIRRLIDWHIYNFTCFHRCTFSR